MERDLRLLDKLLHAVAKEWGDEPRAWAWLTLWWKVRCYTFRRAAHRMLTVTHQ